MEEATVRLYVVRHAIAFPRAHPECPPDPDRPLTEKGRRRMEEATAGLARLEVRPEHVWTSPYRRARETAEIVAEGLGFPLPEVEEHESLEFDQDPLVLLAEIGRITPASILVCGHAPHLDRLIARVLNAPGEATELKKGATACLELPSGPAAPGILHWLLPPRALRRLGRA